MSIEEVSHAITAEMVVAAKFAESSDEAVAMLDALGVLLCTEYPSYASAIMASLPAAKAVTILKWVQHRIGEALDDKTH